MNADEFLDRVNREAPPHLPRADRAFLRRYEIVLGSGQYYQKEIPAAVSLLAVQFEFLGKQKPRECLQAPQPEPQVAISQVVVIHSSDRKQCHRIRQGLFQTGLINFAGPVFVNFSPFTHTGMEALPPNAFAEADYVLERSVFEAPGGEGKTNRWGWSIHPVFFVKDVEPTLVQLYFLASGRRQPSLGPGRPLPSPLYQAFLNVASGSAEAVIDFMNRYEVFLFPMRWDPEKLPGYVSGVEHSMQLLLMASKEQLTGWWSSEQGRMRGVLTAGAQGKLSQVMFPPVFPICENNLVEWRLISGYFDSGLVQGEVPKGARLALFEFKEADTGDAMVHVRRYYGWDSYMWAELLEHMHSGRAALVCMDCGRVISRGSHGRPKQFCSKAENPACYRRRNAKKVSDSRRKGMTERRNP